MAGTQKLEGEIAEKANKMLLKICQLLDEHNIPYTLEAGTLLGIVREDRLLPWDTDLDIVSFSSHIKQIKRLKWKIWFKLGYRLKIRYQKKDVPAPFKKGDIRVLKVQVRRFYFLKAYNLLDIFIKEKIDDHYYWFEGTNPTVLKSVPAIYHDQRTRLRYNGYNFSVVRDYENYLEYRYGDWKTPVKDYHHMTDDNALRTAAANT